MKNVRKGFTLIELLVVIAIIGILSAVVLASLNNARAKGQDAAVKSNLSGARAQAELYYNSNTNTYTGVCGTTAASDGTKTINGQVLAAAQTVGIATVSLNAIGSATVASCNNDANNWAAQVPLKSAGFYCVDSAGTGTTSATTLLSATNDYTC
jgi:type IV pilus assembly protein PilA